MKSLVHQAQYIEVYPLLCGQPANVMKDCESCISYYLQCFKFSACVENGIVQYHIRWEFSASKEELTNS